MKTTVEDIHESLINGQRSQMAAQIKSYGPEFWADYRDYLSDYYDDTDASQSHAAFSYFSDAVISYHRR